MTGNGRMFIHPEQGRVEKIVYSNQVEKNIKPNAFLKELYSGEDF